MVRLITVHEITHQRSSKEFSISEHGAALFGSKAGKSAVYICDIADHPFDEGNEDHIAFATGFRNQQIISHLYFRGDWCLSGSTFGAGVFLLEHDMLGYWASHTTNFHSHTYTTLYNHFCSFGSTNAPWLLDHLSHPSGSLGHQHAAAKVPWILKDFDHHGHEWMICLFRWKLWYSTKVIGGSVLQLGLMYFQRFLEPPM